MGTLHLIAGDSRLDAASSYYENRTGSWTGVRFTSRSRRDLRPFRSRSARCIPTFRYQHTLANTLPLGAARVPHPPASRTIYLDANDKAVPTQAK